MLKHIEVTGKNQEDAIARALEQLGMDRDDVSVEVLELGKTGFLGIGSVPAKVRVTFEAPDETPAPPPAVEERKPVVDEKPTPVREEHPRREERPNRGRGQRSNSRPPRQSPEPPSRPAVAAAPEVKSVPVDGDDEIAGKITAFMTGLFRHMEVEAVPQISKNGDTYEVVIQGENLGALIGRRGETLDAIQQLTGYAVNRGRSKRVRIHVDAEHYRARREESLRRLAGKVAGKVVRYRRSVTLDAMNAYERHVIHAALQEYPNISTHSTGTEPNRRVVVSFDPEKG